MIYSFFLYGGLFKSSGFGSSVARAREANESMIKFTQRSWIAANGEYMITDEPMNEVIKATTFTVSWNCKNLLMLS